MVRSAYAGLACSNALPQVEAPLHDRLLDYCAFSMQTVVATCQWNEEK